MVVRLAAAALLCACLPDPRGQCATDADCAVGPAGLFCAEGVCQGPPRGSVEALPSRAFARSETLHVRAHVDRSHGTATGRVVFGGTAIDAAREPDGALGAEVPLSLAPAGVEGAVPFSVELRDDLGHVTALPASVLVDDQPPRLTVDSASVPSSAVLRGTQVTLRVTAQDMTAVTVAGATKNADGSFAISVNTTAAPPAATLFDIAITGTDAVGNSAIVHASIPITRLKYSVGSSSVTSLVLTDSVIFALINHSDFLIAHRSDGTQLARPSTGGNAFAELATDGTRLFFARSDNQVCRMDSSGNIQECCGPFATLTSGPILQGTTPIVGTTGTSATSQRLYAIVETNFTCGNVVGSATLADFAATSPGIAADGTIYSGAVQKVVIATFDGIGWTAQAASETPHYTGSPAFRTNQILLSTSAATLDTYATPIAAAPTTIQIATLGTVISAPTIAADGTAVVTTDDRHAIALRPDGSVRWTVSLPDQATSPPTHGAGDLIYIGTLSGDVLALNLDDGATLWDYNAGAPIRGPLAPGCDGVLYAATDGAIVALVTDAKGLANSPWPRAAHDVRGTGDSRHPLRAADGTCLE